MTNKHKKTPLALIVLDGWGIAKPSKGNAISRVDAPFFNKLADEYPARLLVSSGEKVGLPRGVFGNSEVGHLNLGAGRVVTQDLLRINQSIKDKLFFNNPELIASLAHLKKTEGAWQIMGLVSDGCVHSSLKHLFALLSFAKKFEIKEVYVHVFLDGRDTSRDSGYHFIEALEKEMARLKIGKIATVSGRFYAMDRDNHWERINKAYQAMVNGQGEMYSTAGEAVRASYKRKIFDEEMLPVIIKGTKSITSGDVVIFFNYRADRAREITRALIDNKLKSKDLKKNTTIKNLYFVAFTEYEKSLGLHVAFPSKFLNNCLGEVISRAGLRQLRIAETEKYAHVTYFFNGGREAAFVGEDRMLIPSPRVDSYSSRPEMSAKLICAKLLGELKRDVYDFVLVNFANADMVGHTGNIPAATKGIKAVDTCLNKICGEIFKRDGTVLVTSDHGNADEMYDFKKRKIIKEHSLNPVPFIAVEKKLMINKLDWVALDRLVPTGRLADVAPTVIKLLNLKKPKEMTGRSLI